MFAYDKNGKVYRVTETGFQIIGITLKDEKHSLTISQGATVASIDETGRVASIEEIIAKFHVTEDHPIDIATERRRGRKPAVKN